MASPDILWNRVRGTGEVLSGTIKLTIDLSPGELHYAWLEQRIANDLGLDPESVVVRKLSVGETDLPSTDEGRYRIEISGLADDGELDPGDVARDLQESVRQSVHIEGSIERQAQRLAADIEDAGRGLNR